MISGERGVVTLSPTPVCPPPHLACFPPPPIPSSRCVREELHRWVFYIVHSALLCTPTCPSAPSSCPSHPAPPSRWVREELHRWVFDNVRTKWAGVLRKPARLPELFSGYRASRALVYEVGMGTRGAGWRDGHILCFGTYATTPPMIVFQLPLSPPPHPT